MSTSLYVDDKGWLTGDGCKLVPSPRHSPLAVATPWAPVTHTTDVPTPAAIAAEHWAQPVPATEHPASAQAIVGRDGIVYQCVSFLAAAWHVRGGGLVAGRQVDHVNHYSTGIELENIGQLRAFSGGPVQRFQRWPYYREVAGVAAERNGLDPGLAVDPARVVAFNGRWYDGFTPAQLGAYQQLVAALASRYGWLREHCGMGHVDYEPARKEDPWPLFRQQHQAQLLDRAFASS